MDAHTETIHTAQPSATAFQPVQILPAGARIGARYEIKRVLGMGGYAVVYAARDLELRTDVALKVLRSDRFSESALTRFRREASVAREAASPSLVRIYDIGGGDADSLFLTMELVDGESLRDRIHRGVLGVDECLRVAVGVLRGLSVLHSLGIVHRDMKPGNILLENNGGVKIADFGLARRFDSDETRATQTETIVGTFEYLAPEQALGLDADARTDLYSFGIVLYEMLTGSVPHQRASSLGTVIAHFSQEAPNVRDSRADVPAWLSLVLRRLLESNARYRYRSADEVLKDIEKQRAPKDLRKRRLKVVSSAMLLLLMAAAGAFGIRAYQLSRFERIVNDGNRGVIALDAAGRALWRKSGMYSGHNAIVARTDAGAPPRIVAIESGDRGVKPELRVFEAQSGKLLETRELPDPAFYFPEFSNQFGGNRLLIDDIDRDGLDDVVFSTVHTPYWPSLGFVYMGHSIVPLFAASGHHGPIAIVDVNGDGRKEVIVAGINNRMGWSVGLGAVDVPVPNAAGTQGIASTPDANHGEDASRDFLWYTILPPNVTIGSACKVDYGRRLISVAYPDGQRFEVGFDGFLVGSHAAPSVDRERERHAAYAEMRIANRASGGRNFADAKPAIQSAVDHARAANDRFLIAWIEQVQARIAVISGDVKGGTALFDRLTRESITPSEVCWEAARAFDGRGDLALAAEWYSRGLSLGTVGLAGRLKYEFAEGAVVALCQLGRWEDAQRVTYVHQRLRPPEGYYSDLLRGYIAWRQTGRPTAVAPSVNNEPDLERYWRLEFRAAEGESPRSVLDAIDSTRRSFSENTPLLDSLRAALLMKLGRNADAYSVARTAMSDALRESESDPITRAHLPIVRERLRRAASAAGRAAEVRASIAADPSVQTRATAAAQR